MSHIAIVVGSNGKNLTIAQEFEKHFSALGHQASIIDLVALDLPLYTPANEGKFSAAQVVASFADALNASHYVFISPEYNGSMTPAMVNFIAWCSRSSKEWRAHFNGKKAAIATHSGGAGFQVLAIMRLQLAFIGMTVIGRQISSTDSKPLDQKSLQDVCHQLLS